MTSDPYSGKTTRQAEASLKGDLYLALLNCKRGWERNPTSNPPGDDDGVLIANCGTQWEWWYFDFFVEGMIAIL